MQKSIRVVVADDNDITRTMLRSMLRQEGIDVIGEARDGIGVIAQCEVALPHIVCLDVEMAHMDGITALREIKKRWPEVGVLMVSGHAERKTIEAAIDAGADGYILKPFNAERVLEAVSRLIGRLAHRHAQPPAAGTPASPKAE